MCTTATGATGSRASSTPRASVVLPAPLGPSRAMTTTSPHRARAASASDTTAVTWSSRGARVTSSHMGATLPSRRRWPSIRRMPVATRVIACLDVDAGRVVKGVNFENLRDAGDPVELAKLYDEQGVDELTFLDVTASSGDRETMYDVVRRTAEQVFIPLTVGGGVRTVDDVDRLLRAGADKVGVNTAAIARPELIAEIASRFGAQVLVLSADVRRRLGDDGQPTGRLRHDDARRPHPGRPRRGRVVRAGRRARSGGDPAQLDGRRRHARTASTSS